MKSTRNRILTIGAAVMLAVAAFAQGWHGHGDPKNSTTCSNSLI